MNVELDTSPLEPTALQLDALREVANVGCGHAASALSRLVGGRIVDLSVPRALVTPTGELPAFLGGGNADVLAATLGVEGDLEGQLLLILPQQDALTLAALMLQQPVAEALDELAQSAISEAANIVASACLSAIGTLTGMRLLPTIPALRRVQASTIAKEMTREMEGQTTVVLEARFSTRVVPVVEGRILMVPRGTSLRRLLARLGF